MMDKSVFPASPMRRRVMGAFGALPLLVMMPRALAAVAAPEISMLEAVNEAGRQRTLPQRVAKFYAQQLAGVRADEAGRLKTEAISLFDTQTRTLVEFATKKNAPNILSTYKQLGSEWSSYKALATGQTDLGDLKQIASMNEQLLVLTQKGTDEFSKLSGTQFGKLVALAGRNRMFSQRLPMFYFFQACGLNTPQIDAQIDAGRKEFVANMAALKASPDSNKRIQSTLALVDTQWMFLETALNGAKDDKKDVAYMRNNVAVASENIFEVMNQLVGMYASLG